MLRIREITVKAKTGELFVFCFFFITEILSEEGLLAQSSAKGRWRNRQAKATWDRPCVGLVGI